MNYALSCTPSVQALNKLHPSLLEVFINCPSPPAPQLPLLHSGYCTTTNSTPCHIISYSLFSFLSRNLTTACSYDPCNPFSFGIFCSPLLPQPTFHSRVSKCNKRSGRTGWVQLHFPVRDKAPAFAGMCQGAAPTSDNAPGFVSYTTTPT